jgi:uncharacterized protein YbjT (DUF2867 family)
MPKVLVTGANGHLGRRLIRTLPPTYAIEAVVRSPRARRMLERHVGDRAALTISIADPSKADELAQLAASCDAAVHLIGTIKETRDNRYVDSHTLPAQALVETAARAGLRRILYLSILGADPASRSHCLRARAEVEHILSQAAIPTTVIRVPMVLGEGDRASLALARRASTRQVFLFRGESLEQPIYAGDVIAAIVNALDRTESGTESQHRVHDLAGPESLSRHTLVVRAAAMLNQRPVIRSLPLGLGIVLAQVLQWIVSRPPITPEMLRVLDHDDAIDPRPAATELGITLTPLDTMLARCLPRAP